MIKCSLLFGQDSACFKKTLDKFTDVTTYNLRDIIKLDEKTTFYAIAGGKGSSKASFTIFFDCPGIVSVDEKSYALLLFADGTKLKLGNSSSYNLDGSFMITFWDKAFYNKPLKEFLSKKIKGIRLSGFSTTYDVDLTSEVSDEFYSGVTCLYNEWKKEK